MPRHNFTGKHTYRSLLIGALLLGGSSLAGLSVFAASPTPGTVIENQATGSYIDESDNSTQTLVSDKVTVTVGEVTGITVTPANTPSAISGVVVNFDFTITNVGNDPTQFFIPDAPSAITGGTAGTLKIVAYDSDGSGPAAAVDLTGNNITVPANGANTGTLLSAIASANNGSIPAGATIVVRVPVTVTATGGQTVSVTLGNTSGQPSNSNTPYILGANGTGSKDLYTVDNADGVSGESAGVPINGDATNHRQEASAIQTVTAVNPINISGTIYRDNDRSSTNNSEPGIGNITVILYQDNDNNRELSPSEIIQQVTTLADGSYQFTNVPAGTYKIKVDIADPDVPVGYTLGTTDNLPVTVNTTSITGKDFGFYPALTCEWEAQIYSGHYPIPGAAYAKDTQSVGLFGTGGLPTLRGTAKFGAEKSTFTFNDQSISQTAHPLRTIINGSFVSSGYVPINGDYISTQTNFGQPSWVIVFKRQAIAKGRVTLGQAGAYIDDAMEIYINGVRVANPILTYNTSLPANKVSTVSVNAGDIVEIRLSNYDNVGGFVVSTDFAYEFGDAPSSYGEVSQAPSCSNPHLGATVTGESSQTYSANASGDAGDDGVTLPSNLTPGTTATIIVNASTAGFLNSWIDFNQNGVFDSGEQLNITNVTKGTAATVNNVPLNAGNNTLTFTVPSNATVGGSFARFRFTASAVATPSPTGSGDAGEVEDYAVPIATIPNVLLVKRITAINGDRTKNPNDNTPLNAFVDDTTSPRQADDNSPNWKPNYLLGAIDAGKVKPGDEIEYTIYFLNAGSTNANTVKVCDRISANQNFKVGAYGTNKDVQLQLGTSTVVDLTSANDAGDRTQLISAGGTVPTNCYLKAANDNGTLVIDVTGNTGLPNLTTMPGSTGQGSPNDSYGNIRFVTKVKP
ncbi:MAG: GEVED domain-containing protein [Nostoc sp.]|uniref:beta strand repeat-containing protein n=1 Tax=Nostoc sp. TaxID=1180 RepID=UPI002FFB51A8